MSTKGILEFNAHVRTGSNALITILIDSETYEFDLFPTVNWVPSSTAIGSHKISVQLDLPPIGQIKKVYVNIAVKNSDLLICGYNIPTGYFTISSQPEWNVPTWQPYDISGHGTGKMFEGNGSLQILNGQNVKFEGNIIRTS